MITKYGFDVLIKYSVIITVIVILTFTVIHGKGLRWTIVIVIAVATCFVLNFFRDPERVTPDETGIVVSPADGKIVLIKELFEPEYLKQNAVQISVFMSPLDVHVNRFPISGTIGYYKYIEGKYLVAFNDKSSELNERTHIGIEGGNGKVLFKQIAGTIARRIIADIHVGQKATIGERFGMIRFGSRVDVIIPRESVVAVKLNDRVKAGETILARYSSTQGLK